MLKGITVETEGFTLWI